jgi:hypothetical protein
VWREAGTVARCRGTVTTQRTFFYCVLSSDKAKASRWVEEWWLYYRRIKKGERGKKCRARPQTELRNLRNFWQISGQASSSHSQYKISVLHVFSDICNQKARVLRCDHLCIKSTGGPTEDNRKFHMFSCDICYPRPSPFLFGCNKKAET